MVQRKVEWDRTQKALILALPFWECGVILGKKLNFFMCQGFSDSYSIGSNMKETYTKSSRPKSQSQIPLGARQLI